MGKGRENEKNNFHAWANVVSCRKVECSLTPLSCPNYLTYKIPLQQQTNFADKKRRKIFFLPQKKKTFVFFLFTNDDVPRSYLSSTCSVLWRKMISRWCQRRRRLVMNIKEEKWLGKSRWVNEHGSLSFDDNQPTTQKSSEQNEQTQSHEKKQRDEDFPKWKHFFMLKKCFGDDGDWRKKMFCDDVDVVDFLLARLVLSIFWLTSSRSHVSLLLSRNL